MSSGYSFAMKEEVLAIVPTLIATSEYSFSTFLKVWWGLVKLVSSAIAIIC
jgi:hypothetical protein